MLVRFSGKRLVSLCVWTLGVTTQRITGSTPQLTHCASLGVITGSLCASVSICTVSQMPTVHKSLSDCQMRCCVSVEQCQFMHIELDSNIKHMPRKSLTDVSPSAGKGEAWADDLARD